MVSNLDYYFKWATKDPRIFWIPDLCGPTENVSLGGAKYFFTLNDDHSRKTFVYFFKAKFKVTKAFANFKSMVENETDKRIKIIRSDNGTDYCNTEFQDLLRMSGIKHKTTIR